MTFEMAAKCIQKRVRRMRIRRLRMRHMRGVDNGQQQQLQQVADGEPLSPLQLSSRRVPRSARLDAATKERQAALWATRASSAATEVLGGSGSPVLYTHLLPEMVARQLSTASTLPTLAAASPMVTHSAALPAADQNSSPPLPPPPPAPLRCLKEPSAASGALRGASSSFSELLRASSSSPTATSSAAPIWPAVSHRPADSNAFRLRPSKEAPVDRRGSTDAGAFAYGGIYPGVLHARGKLHQTHRVQYSVGRVGTYKLHVALRSQGRVLPGSPFLLKVVPGLPSSLFTCIAASEPLPLSGVVGLPCRGVVLCTHDSAGNRCVLGGAPLHVACDDPNVACTWIDHEDGTFTLSWEAQRCGSYLLSVAVDGVDVNGSPFPLIMLDPQHVIDALPVETDNADLSQLDVGWDEEIEEGDRLG